MSWIDIEAHKVACNKELVILENPAIVLEARLHVRVTLFVGRLCSLDWDWSRWYALSCREVRP
jgi:hypothetical protein